MSADRVTLARAFPVRALDMARAGGLGFLGAPPEIVGCDPVLRFPRPIGEAAATAVSLCGDAAAEVWRQRGGRAQRPRVDVRAAAAGLAGYAYQLLRPGPAARPADWEAEAGGWSRAWGAQSLLRGRNASNPAVGIYRCADGRWLHIHGGTEVLAERLTCVLGASGDGIPAAIARRTSEDLEDAIAEAGSCAAIVRNADEWARHPQGRLLRDLPVVEVLRVGDAPPRPLPAGDGPFGGLKVLDLAVALAGPVCARTLAQHGAEVLHVGAPDRVDRQPFEIETGHGKASTVLDLRHSEGRAQLASLTREADVFSQGYRSGALARLGFGVEDVAALAPGIVYVSINCYGPVGPWVARRGWEGLAQATTGLTVRVGPDAPPRLAPGSVCDYLTGYLTARGVMEAVLRRAVEGGSWHVRASLCQTGMWLENMGDGVDESRVPEEPDLFEDLLVERDTPFGRLRHLPPALHLDATPPRWNRPPPLPGADPPRWTPA